MDKKSLQFLPVTLNITEKKLVIIGGGKVAFHKATILSRFTQEATVIAPAFVDGFEALPFYRLQKEYKSDDLIGAFLVYICTGDEALNAAIKAECEQQGILASVCDNPTLCDFISPAIYKAGNLTISVASNAEDVRRSIDVRNQIQVLVDNQTLRIK
jgi:siroheme synthase-like protein